MVITIQFFSMQVSFMNNQKQQKPTLTGQRFKTRKRGTCLDSKYECKALQIHLDIASTFALPVN